MKPTKATYMYNKHFTLSKNRIITININNCASIKHNIHKKQTPKTIPYTSQTTKIKGGITSCTNQKSGSTTAKVLM